MLVYNIYFYIIYEYVEDNLGSIRNSNTCHPQQLLLQKCYAWINYFNIFRPGPMDRSLGTADNGL